LDSKIKNGRIRKCAILVAVEQKRKRKPRKKQLRRKRSKRKPRRRNNLSLLVLGRDPVHACCCLSRTH